MGLIPTTNPHHIINSGARRLISRDYRRVLGAKVLTTWRRGQCLLEPGVWDHVGVGHQHSLPFWARKQSPRQGSTNSKGGETDCADAGLKFKLSGVSSLVPWLSESVCPHVFSVSSCGVTKVSLSLGGREGGVSRSLSGPVT